MRSTDPMPAVNQLIGGDLAWRQHSGGHTEQPNWPHFSIGSVITSSRRLYRQRSAQLIRAVIPMLRISRVFSILMLVCAGAVLTAPRKGLPPFRGPAGFRTDQNSLTAHVQLLEKAKKGGIDIYFESFVNPADSRAFQPKKFSPVGEESAG